MINSKEKKKNELSAKSVIYGALFTFVLIVAIFCGYVIAATIKLISIVLGPVIFSIVTAGIILLILLGVFQHIKAEKAKEKREKDDA